MTSSKPDELKSVPIQNQSKSGTCYAHACSRNFERTLQILGVITSKYNTEFYFLFLYYLTEKESCQESGNYTKLFDLLNYLKNNYDNESSEDYIFKKNTQKNMYVQKILIVL
jgi:hypothetical protein